MNLLSIVVPCYNEQDVIPIFYREISKVANRLKDLINFEFIFVDDGSSDSTLQITKDLEKNDSRVKYLSFSRNFGKEAAILAGLKKSAGNYVAIMDVDLQDPPELLEEMYNIVKNGTYDCVATRRVSRKGEPPIRSFFARLFYRIINKISNTEIVDGARDYRLMSRKMVDSILSLTEYNRFSKGIFGWVGFKTKWLEYENIQRAAGETKWSFWKLFIYSIEGIVAFSTFPLAIPSILAIIFLFTSAISLILALTNFICGWSLPNYFLLLVSIMSFFNATTLLCMGIFGEYLSKTYSEIKHRPIYIIKEEN